MKADSLAPVRRVRAYYISNYASFTLLKASFRYTYRISGLLVGVFASFLGTLTDFCGGLGLFCILNSDLLLLQCQICLGKLLI